MAVGLVDRVVGTRVVPDVVRVRSSLPAVDYVDEFTLFTAVDAQPERWARAMFGDVAGPAGRLIWQGVLHLRLSGRPSPAVVGGWQVDGRGDDWIRLATGSWFLDCNLLVEVAPGQVSLTTYLRYARRPGLVVWPPASAVHRRLVPGLLLAAEARLVGTPSVEASLRKLSEVS